MMTLLAGSAGVAIIAVPCICFPFVGLITLTLFAFWIWMIVDVVTNEPAEDPNKVVWVLVVVLLHSLGAAIYFFVRRPERIQKYGR
jgi:hypothetical protein